MSIPIFDGHNDALLHLLREGGHASFLEGGDGQVDLPKAREGGLGGGLFACFVPRKLFDVDPDEERTPIPGGYELSLAGPLDPEHAREHTESMMSLLYQVVEDSEGEVELVRDAGQLVRCLDEGILAAVLHFEGAEAIEDDLSNLQTYYDAGLRSLGLVWSRPNVFGHGVQFRFPSSADTGPGLTPEGKRLVEACNELGILVDVSHLNERGFWDVAEVTAAPLVATHSNAHALCPSSRNLTDDQLEAIAQSGGLVGINFGCSDVRGDGEDDPETPLSDLVFHLDYIARRIGIDHVAFGSDFDGNIIPAEIGDAAGLPRLLEALAEHGYDEDDLRKIACGNWVRVLSQTWR